MVVNSKIFLVTESFKLSFQTMLMFQINIKRVLFVCFPLKNFFWECNFLRKFKRSKQINDDFQKVSLVQVTLVQEVLKRDTKNLHPKK